MYRTLLLSIFAAAVMAGPLNELKRRETCYQVDCNPDTGECQGTLPDCEMGYCSESTLVCLYVSTPFEIVYFAPNGQKHGVALTCLI